MGIVQRHLAGRRLPMEIVARSSQSCYKFNGGSSTEPGQLHRLAGSWLRYNNQCRKKYNDSYPLNSYANILNQVDPCCWIIPNKLSDEALGETAVEPNSKARVTHTLFNNSNHVTYTLVEWWFHIVQCFRSTKLYLIPLPRTHIKSVRRQCHQSSATSMLTGRSSRSKLSRRFIKYIHSAIS